jgi:hypothetical protein
LGRRVQNAYPNLKVANIQAQKRAPGRSQVRTPASAPARSSAGSQSGVSRVNGKATFKLTAAEQNTMKRHNLDPSNKLHQKAWAKSRMESARRAQNSGR